MGIRMKILSGFLILTLMLFIAGIWSIYELSTVGESVQGLLDDNYKSINAAKTMIESLEREDSAVLLLLSGNWKEGRSVIQSADRAFQGAFETARNNVTIPGEQDNIRRIKESYRTYKDSWIKPIVGTSKEDNLDWYFREVHPRFLDAKASVEELMTLNDKTMYRTASNLKARAHRAVMPGVVAILAALIFAVIFNYFVNCYIVGPIIKITNGIQGFLKTRQSFDVRIETKDELFHLVSSIEGLLAQLKKGEATE